MRSVIVVVGLLGCGDNRVPEAVVPVDTELPDPDASVSEDAASDATPPDDGVITGPDLTWVASMMDNSILIMPGTFTANSCEMQEACIGAEGTRRLLRFDAVTENIGSEDLVLGPPPAAGVSDATFTWSECHGHHHFNGYASYELLDGDGVLVTGRKQAFCLLDTLQRQIGKPSNGYVCGNQGLTAGWADVYNRGLPCQWIDITGLASGTYTLRVVVNPLGLLPELDTTNNEYTKSVTF
jgi:hypothetical protein